MDRLHQPGNVASRRVSRRIAARAQRTIEGRGTSACRRNCYACLDDVATGVATIPATTPATTPATRPVKRSPASTESTENLGSSLNAATNALGSPEIPRVIITRMALPISDSASASAKIAAIPNLSKGPLELKMNQQLVPTKMDCGRQSPMLVTTKLPCGHTVDMPCHKDPLTFPCPRPCATIVEPCGHVCLLKCHIRKDPDHLQYKCKKTMAAAILGSCGHFIEQIVCHLSQKTRNPNILQQCTEPCGIVLKCGHQCEGNCGTCFQGRFHKRCSSNCGVPLVCNHLCRYPCRNACRSCAEPCTFKCAHGRCNKLCSEVCIPCKEPCPRRCPHSHCPNLCSQPCLVAPCEEPCEQLLKCGHKCAGFCGDPCLSSCMLCKPDDFNVFFGTEDKPDARFVELQDCQHIVENSGMVNWLKQDSGIVGFKVCPKCKTPIKATHRYSDYAKRAEQDVILVKAKLVGLPEENETARKTLSDAVRVVWNKANHVLTRKALGALMGRLSPTRNGKRQPIDKVQLNAITSKFQLIERLIEATSNCPGRSQKLVYDKHMEAILAVVVDRDENYITDQEIDDASREIDRLSKTISFNGIDRSQKSLITPAIKKMFKRGEVLASAPKAYTQNDDEEFAGILNELKRTFAVTLISKTERRQIMKAMGFPKGHWFKCPNGHVYAIGDCGGATNKSKCFECGKAIGGTNYRLLQSNSLATEMDGATNSAYSATANNLANWNLF